MTTITTARRLALATAASAALAACSTANKPAEKPPAAAPAPTSVAAPALAATATPAAKDATVVFAVPQPDGTTVQGGSHQAFAYSEKPDDAKLDKLAVANGVARVTGTIWPQKGSSWAGIGYAASAGAAGKTVDASALRTLRIQLASPSATQLRVRVMGTDQATRDAGCYPVAMVAVSAELKEHAIPLASFQPEGYCGPKGKTIAATAGAVAAVEVTDPTVAGKRAVDYQVGRIALTP